MTKTSVEVRDDGTRWTFHRRGKTAWDHPVDEPYMIDSVSPTVKLPCPVCKKPLVRRTK